MTGGVPFGSPSKGIRYSSREADRGQPLRVDASFLGNPKSVRRTGEKVFGVIAIVAGTGLIAAVIAGVEVSNVVLILIPLVIIGWSVYYYVVVRPPHGV
jgi:hypothetical protein